jgi:hypothetical protein
MAFTLQRETIHRAPAGEERDEFPAYPVFGSTSLTFLLDHEFGPAADVQQLCGRHLSEQR